MSQPVYKNSFVCLGIDFFLLLWSLWTQIEKDFFIFLPLKMAQHCHTLIRLVLSWAVLYCSKLHHSVLSQAMVHCSVLHHPASCLQGLGPGLLCPLMHPTRVCLCQDGLMPKTMVCVGAGGIWCHRLWRVLRKSHQCSALCQRCVVVQFESHSGCSKGAQWVSIFLQQIP